MLSWTYARVSIKNKNEKHIYRPFNYLPVEHRSYTALYVPGHARAAPYFVGVFAAYVYRYLKLDRPDFRFPYPKTLAWTLVAVYPLALMTAPVSYVRPYRLWLSVAYTFAYRTVFATVVSAFIIVCAVNGLVAGKRTGVVPPRHSSIWTRKKLRY